MTERGVMLRVEIEPTRALRPASLACHYSRTEAGLWTDFGIIEASPIREWPLWEGVELIANGNDGSIFGLQGYCPRESVEADTGLPHPFFPEEVTDADVLVTSVASSCDYETLLTDRFFVAHNPKMTATTFVQPGTDGLIVGIADDLLCAVQVKRTDDRQLFRRLLRAAGNFRNFRVKHEVSAADGRAG